VAVLLGLGAVVNDGGGGIGAHGVSLLGVMAAYRYKVRVKLAR
jgi:hypothetical protein